MIAIPFTTCAHPLHGYDTNRRVPACWVRTNAHEDGRLMDFVVEMDLLRCFSSRPNICTSCLFVFFHLNFGHCEEHTFPSRTLPASSKSLLACRITPQLHMFGLPQPADSYISCEYQLIDTVPNSPRDSNRCHQRSTTWGAHRPALPPVKSGNGTQAQVSGTVATSTEISAGPSPAC